MQGPTAVDNAKTQNSAHAVILLHKRDSMFFAIMATTKIIYEDNVECWFVDAGF